MVNKGNQWFSQALIKPLFPGGGGWLTSHELELETMTFLTLPEPQEETSRLVPSIHFQGLFLLLVSGEARWYTQLVLL